MTRALTFITDASDIDVVPPIQNGNKLNHTIGLGAMGLHTYLAKEQNGIWLRGFIGLYKIFTSCC